MPVNPWPKGIKRRNYYSRTIGISPYSKTCTTNWFRVSKHRGHDRMINTSARKWALCSCSATLLLHKICNYPSVLNNCDNWVGGLGWAPFFILCLDLGRENSAFYPTILDVKPKYPQTTSTSAVLWTVRVDDCLATSFSALVSKVTGALVLNKETMLERNGPPWSFKHTGHVIWKHRRSSFYFAHYRPFDLTPVTPSALWTPRLFFNITTLRQVTRKADQFNVCHHPQHSMPPDLGTTPGASHRLTQKWRRRLKKLHKVVKLRWMSIIHS